ncbi:MAG: hypothetical protein FWE82_01330 [Defluviitaleaceae bacterium]|nr:hypothetical protein [Defluviitaleaceae bacterium]
MLADVAGGAAMVILIALIFGVKRGVALSVSVISYGLQFSVFAVTDYIIFSTAMQFADKIFFETVTAENALIYIVGCAFSALVKIFIVFGFFKIERLKKGFAPIFNEGTALFSLAAAGFFILFTAGFPVKFINVYDFLNLTVFLFGAAVSGAGIILLVKRAVTMKYADDIRQRDIEFLETDLREKNRQINILTVQTDILRVESHKINHRLTALERSVACLAEHGAELNEINDDIKNISDGYQNGVDKINILQKLPSTGVASIDRLLEHFQEKILGFGIDFEIKIYGSIFDMTEKIISKNNLETLIGDLLQNAVSVVNKKNDGLKNIFTVIGSAGGPYELTVFDSGDMFDANCFAKLGAERVTTKPVNEKGGIGFMTVFDIMNESKASLFIEEFDPSKSNYSKSVTVRFDGKKTYTIKTFRENEIPFCERYSIVK